MNEDVTTDEVAEQLPLRVLIVEEHTADAELMLIELRRAGFDPTWLRVVTEDEFLEGLRQGTDMILADYALPRFGALRALHLMRAQGLDIPLIVVTAAIGEEIAVECIKQGANDYLMKDRLARLGQAVRNAAEAKQTREEKRRAEKALQESEERYRTLVETAEEGVWMTDADSKTTFVNQKMSDMLGYTIGEMVGQPFSHFVDTKIQGIVQERLDRRSLKLKGQFDIVFRRKDGTRIQTIVSTTPIVNEKGLYAGRLGMVTDISLRKQAEDNLVESFALLQRTLEGTIEAIATAIERRDPYTAGHQQRVALLARAIAEEMGLEDTRSHAIRLAASIHDVGKLSVPAEILSKPGQLTPAELSLIKSHPEVGCEILKPVEFPWPIAEIMLQHHERMDGSGYPYGLSGEDILPEARILAVADVVEAMASHRPYRPSLGIDAALEYVSYNRDLLYDRHAVNACVRLFDERGFRLETH